MEEDLTPQLYDLEKPVLQVGYYVSLLMAIPCVCSLVALGCAAAAYVQSSSCEGKIDNLGHVSSVVP